MTATPSTILSGGTSSVKADFSFNSNGAAVLPVVLNGLPITFDADNGTMSPTSAPLAAFMATSTYTNTSCPFPPPEMVAATLDNGTDTADVTIDCNADLAVTKTDNPDPVQAGNNLTYTVFVANNGPANATGVTMTETVPAGVSFVSATPTQGSCSGTSPVVCNLGSLAVNADATVTLVVTPTAAGTISNTASVTGNENDPTPANDEDTEQTTVAPAPTTTTTTLPPTTTTTTLPTTTTTTTLPPTTTTTTLPPTTTTTLPPTTTTTTLPPPSTTLPPPSTTLPPPTTTTLQAPTTTTLPPTTTTTLPPPTTTTTLPPRVVTCDGQPATIVGTNGDDTINGTHQRDVIHALGGNDRVNGRKGNDLICGGDGNDRLHGNKGADDLFGQKGNDRLNGDAGFDTCHGGRGNNDGARNCQVRTGIP